MIITGGRSVNEITKILWNFDNITLCSIVIGALICLWIIMGNSGFKKLNSVAVVLLLGLTVVLSFIVFKDGSLFSAKGTGSISFGGALELSIIMPLSWLPLIADYTRLVYYWTSLCNSF
jgi:purine-cytosine permease-like protein